MYPTHAENLASELMNITDQWRITLKIVSVTTDNVSYITAAVGLNAWKYLPCLTHTYYIVYDYLKANCVYSRESIEKLFHTFTTALISIHTHLKICNHKLIENVGILFSTCLRG